MRYVISSGRRDVPLFMALAGSHTVISSARRGGSLFGVSSQEISAVIVVKRDETAFDGMAGSHIAIFLDVFIGKTANSVVSKRDALTTYLKTIKKDEKGTTLITGRRLSQTLWFTLICKKSVPLFMALAGSHTVISSARRGGSLF